MGQVLPIPRLGAVLSDARGAGRALRVSWHGEDDLVVLSLWDGPRCTGTVRLAAADVPELIEALQLGLVGAPPAAGAPDVPDAGTAGPGRVTADGPATRGPGGATAAGTPGVAGPGWVGPGGGGPARPG